MILAENIISWNLYNEMICFIILRLVLPALTLLSRLGVGCLEPEYNGYIPQYVAPLVPVERFDRSLDSITYMETSDGVMFGIWGFSENGHPKPVLIMMASSIEETLGSAYFRQCGTKLVEQNDWLCISLDLPSHGSQIDKNSGVGLEGWAQRIANGDDIVQENNQRVKSVLDYLIERGLIDKSRIAVSGTSRGGYLALHYAVYDQRVVSVVAYAPVTSLSVLKEFGNLSNEHIPSNMDLNKKVYELSKVDIWAAIGEDDQRVGTNAAAKLFDSIKQLNSGKDISLHILPSIGHTTPPNALELSYDWVVDKFYRQR